MMVNMASKNIRIHMKYHDLLTLFRVTENDLFEPKTIKSPSPLSCTWCGEKSLVAITDGKNTGKFSDCFIVENINGEAVVVEVKYYDPTLGKGSRIVDIPLNGSETVEGMLEIYKKKILNMASKTTK